MTEPGPGQAEGIDGGFWRLEVCDLRALLSRRDLNWERARVLLAVACLTRGYRKERDVISLSQICELSGVDHRHVCRALKRLSSLGVYGERKISTRKIERWVTWPPPAVGAQQGTNSVGASMGTNGENQPIAPPPSVGASMGTKVGANGSAHTGTHPESQNKKLLLLPAGGQSSSSNLEAAEMKRRREIPELLRSCGVIEKKIGHFMLTKDLDYLERMCHGYLERKAGGEDIGPGLLVSKIEAGEEWAASARRGEAPKIYRWRCGKCGREHVGRYHRTEAPWPTCCRQEMELVKDAPVLAAK